MGRLLFAACLLALPAPARAADCAGMQAGGAARALTASDGRTILLEDGREIRLAGIEAAYPPARQALAQRVSGRLIDLRGLSERPDRHGRIEGFAAVNGSAMPLQHDLVRAGLVRAAGPLEPAACRAALLKLEGEARAAKLGLWSDPVYDVLRADNPGAIGNGRGRFAIVEGRILSVRESGGTLYLNFGARWSEDFTATIPKRLERRFAAAGLAPQTLAGRHVRIRGIVEERGGPWIEAVRPDQIELTDNP